MPFMPTLADRRRATAEAVDASDAEPVRLLPLRKGVQDPDRQPVDVQAVLRVGGGEQKNMDGGRAQNWRTQLAAGKAELHVAAFAFPEVRFDTGDKIMALGRPGEPMWEILRVDDRGENRLVLELGEV